MFAPFGTDNHLNAIQASCFVVEGQVCGNFGCNGMKDDECPSGLGGGEVTASLAN